MTKTVQHISLKKSAIPGKVPAKNVLSYGELAVNYGEGGEKIFLQNTANNIVEFSSDGLLDKKYLSTTSGGTVSGDTEFKGDVKIVYPDSTSKTVSLREVMVDNELAISAALNDLSAKVDDQKTDIDTIKTKECLPLSGGTINGNLIVSGNTEFKGDVKIAYPDLTSQTVSLREVMVGNEEVTSAALNELNERISDQRTDIDTIKAKESLPLSGGTVSGDTEFKGDVKIVYPDSTSQTVSLREVMVDNEMTISAALNDLNARVDDQKTDIDTIKTKESLPLSGGTVSGDTEFKGDVKIVYPDATSQTVSLREVIVDNEEVTSAALNELNERISDQKADIDTIKAKECLPLSGGTINGDLIVSGDTEFKGDVKIVYPDSTSQTVSLREVMVDNEMAISAALNDLSAKVNDQKADIDTIKAKECLPLSGGTVSGETTFNKDVKVVFPNSETPTSLVSAIVDNEKVTAAALNDLNEKFDNYLPFSGGTLNGQLTVHELYIYDTNGVKYKFNVAALLSGDCITRV